MYEGKSYMLPWVVAIFVAVLSEYYLGGKWYVILGAISGSLAGVFVHKRQENV